MKSNHKPIAIQVGTKCLVDPECPDCGMLHLIDDQHLVTCPCGCVFMAFPNRNGRIQVVVYERATNEARAEMKRLRRA